MQESVEDFWRKCSVCKKPISFGSPYLVCSVSTCNGERTGYVFCRMQCFETHLPGARHRDAGAIEKIAPRSATTKADEANRRIVVRPQPSQPVSESKNANYPAEVLVIASRFKDFIQARGDMNTSQAVMDTVSDHLRELADLAVQVARQDGRKTVMDRDIATVLRKHWKV